MISRYGKSLRRRPGSRRLLQVTVALLSLVPITAGGAGATLGPGFMGDLAGAPASRDLDSHARYLSGLLLGIGLLFLQAVPTIERQGARFRILGLVVVTGGLARLLGLALGGAPGPPHLLALALELVAVPLLVLWQARVAALSRAAGA